ncbi:MAG: tetratricopeptide repeat protein [Bacteroidales bacterium]|nr:tetratricopeptide repeat protein [Candidatus Cryptobacteroides onthequi]
MRRFIIFLISAVTLACSASIPSYAQNAKAVDNALIDAVALFDRQDYKGALQLLKPLAAAAPDNDAVFYYMGLCSIYTNDAESAETYLQEAARIDPSNFWYRDWLGRLYTATRRPELAIEVTEKLIKDFPKNTELYYSLVNLYAQLGKPEKMLATLDEIEAVQGKSEAVTMTRYDVLMRMEKAEEAFKALEKFNDEFSSPVILSAMGDYRLSQYEDSLALTCYKEALNLDPDCGQAAVGVAEAYRIRRSYPEFFGALTDFVTNGNLALEPKTEYVTMVFQRAEPQFLKNFRPQLDTLIETYLAQAPTDSTALQTAGSYYYATARNDKATEKLARGAELYPASLSSRALYVQLLSYSENWKELADESEKAFAAFPDEPAFLQYKSIAHYNLQDYAGVIEDNERIIAKAPGDTAVTVPALATIGDMYHLLGESKKAYSTYDKVLKLNPTYVPVLNNYAYYLSCEKKNLKKAYAMSKITVEQEPDNSTYLDTFGWILYLQGKAIEAKPFFKHAMLYGGKESATVLDHYAEVLYALKEYDLAKVYWNMAIKKDTEHEIADLESRMKAKLEAVGK